MQAVQLSQDQVWTAQLVPTTRTMVADGRAIGKEVTT